MSNPNMKSDLPKVFILMALCWAFGGITFPTGALDPTATTVLLFILFTAYFLGLFLQDIISRLNTIEEKLNKK